MSQKIFKVLIGVDRYQIRIYSHTYKFFGIATKKNIFANFKNSNLNKIGVTIRVKD